MVKVVTSPHHHPTLPRQWYLLWCPYNVAETCQQRRSCNIQSLDVTWAEFSWSSATGGSSGLTWQLTSLSIPRNPHSLVWIHQFCAPSTFPVTPIHPTQRWWSVDNSALLLTQVSSKYGQRSDETIPKSIIVLLLRPSSEPCAGTRF